MHCENLNKEKNPVMIKAQSKAREGNRHMQIHSIK